MTASTALLFLKSSENFSIASNGRVSYTALFKVLNRGTEITHQSCFHTFFLGASFFIAWFTILILESNSNGFCRLIHSLPDKAFISILNFLSLPWTVLWFQCSLYRPKQDGKISYKERCTAQLFITKSFFNFGF